MISKGKENYGRIITDDSVVNLIEVGRSFFAVSV